MKSKLGLFLAIAAIAVVPAQQSRAASGNLPVQGRVSPSLTITPGATLDFGTILVTTGGSTTLAPDGTPTDVGVTQLGAAAPGDFGVTGRAGVTISSLTFAAANLTCAVDTDPAQDCLGGTNTVTINAATHDWATLTLPAGVGRTTQTVNWGATMSAALTQNSGLYAGVVVVTALY